MDLICILEDSIILFSELPLAEKMGKHLIVSDDDQLEVMLAFPSLKGVHQQGSRKTLCIWTIYIRSCLF